MGQDKAMLPHVDGSLAEHAARSVADAAGTVTLVGAPERYAGLGFPTAADLRPGNGPLGGLETALSMTGADWNLVVACDMPEAEAPFLRKLLAQALGSGADALVPVSPTGPEPLCAVWHRRCLKEVSRALTEGRRAIHGVLAHLDVCFWRPHDSGWQANLNTPEQWERYKRRLSRRASRCAVFAGRTTQ